MRNSYLNVYIKGSCLSRTTPTNILTFHPNLPNQNQPVSELLPFSFTTYSHLLPPDNMTQVQGFTVENQGGSPANIIDPNASPNTIGPSLTSKLFTMKGTYRLQGTLVGGTTLVDVSTIEINAAGFLKITPMAASSSSSQFVVHTLLN